MQNGQLPQSAAYLATYVCSTLQVASLMLRLACYYHAVQLLQPVQQLLAAHGHSIASLVLLLQYTAVATSSDAGTAAFMQALQQHLPGITQQDAASLRQALAAVQQLQQLFAAPVPADILQQLDDICRLPAATTPSSSAAAPPPPAATAVAISPVAAAAGPALDVLRQQQAKRIGFKRTTGGDALEPSIDAKRMRLTRQLPQQSALRAASEKGASPHDQDQGRMQRQRQQLVLKEAANNASQQQNVLQGHMQQEELRHGPQQQQQLAQQQPSLLELEVVPVPSEHGCSPQQQVSSSQQLLQGLQEDSNCCECQAQHDTASSSALAGLSATETDTGIVPDKGTAAHAEELQPRVAMLLAETAAALKAVHGHDYTGLQFWLEFEKGAALVSKLGRGAAAAAAFLQGWPQVFELQTEEWEAQGQGGSGYCSSSSFQIRLQDEAEQWLLNTPHCQQQLGKYRAALVQTAMRGASMAAATPGGLHMSWAVMMMPAQLEPYRRVSDSSLHASRTYICIPPLHVSTPSCKFEIAAIASDARLERNSSLFVPGQTTKHAICCTD
jgi:hypothetical protein